MKLILSPRAEKQLRKTSKVNQIILAKKIRSLKGSNPSNQLPLKGYRNIYRVRVGNFRIVYKKTNTLAFIIVIGHRKEIYKQLKKLLN